MMGVIIEDAPFLAGLGAVLLAMAGAIKHLWSQCNVLRGKVESLSRVLGESAALAESVQHCPVTTCPVRGMHPDPVRMSRPADEVKRCRVRAEDLQEGTEEQTEEILK